MARKAAAIPQPVAMNCRRLRPSFLPFSSASARIRRSTRFCVSLCLGGRYSPLETIWVGIGVAAEAVSAPATRRCSRSLSQLPIVISSLLIVGGRENVDPSVAIDKARPDWVVVQFDYFLAALSIALFQIRKRTIATTRQTTPITP